MSTTDKWAVPTCGLVAIGVSILALQNSRMLFGSTRECEGVVLFALVCATIVGCLNVLPLVASPRKYADVLVAYAAILVGILALGIHAVRQF